MSPPEETSFAWDEAESVLDGLVLLGLPSPEELVYDPARGSFRDPDELIEVVPPPVLPEPSAGSDAETWLEAIPAWLGTHVVVLLRAGAFALGLWEHGELLRHKCEKKYVVRGKGKAQPTHLETKGKSRYGSRLRLQNAKSLLEELRELLGTWLRELHELRGTDPDAIFLGTPPRQRARLLDAPIPGVPDLCLRRLPGDFDEPSFDELGRVYRRLCHGRLVRLD